MYYNIKQTHSMCRFLVRRRIHDQVVYISTVLPIYTIVSVVRLNVIVVLLSVAEFLPRNCQIFKTYYRIHTIGQRMLHISANINIQKNPFRRCLQLCQTEVFLPLSFYNYHYCSRRYNFPSQYSRCIKNLRKLVLVRTFLLGIGSAISTHLSNYI